ncbi:hypothetical protein RBI80_13715 [Klebsiella variicola]|nr:hypothetical protein RBI80_13715 [Klebsiella variicola]
MAGFRAAGYGERQALDVILGVSLATLCNFANSRRKRRSIPS